VPVYRRVEYLDRKPSGMTLNFSFNHWSKGSEIGASSAFALSLSTNSDMPSVLRMNRTATMRRRRAVTKKLPARSAIIRSPNTISIQ
jgi:hypothetical protein